MNQFESHIGEIRDHVDGIAIDADIGRQTNLLRNIVTKLESVGDVYLEMPAKSDPNITELNT